MSEAKPSRRRQGGAVCSAFNCTNAFYSNDNKGYSFFGFPRDKERSRVWIQNARREDLLGMPIDKLSRSYKLCSVHFKASQFTVPSERKRLNWNAVPTRFYVPNIVIPERIYNPQSLLKEPARKRLKMNYDNEVPLCDTTVENEVERSADILISHNEVPHPSPTKWKKLKVKLDKGYWRNTLLAQMQYSKTEMEEDKEPFPTMLFVNEAFLRTKAPESSVTEAKIERYYQSSDFRFQKSTSTVGAQTEEKEFGNSGCNDSNDNAVRLRNEKCKGEGNFITDSNKKECKSETQVSTDSLLFNDSGNIEIKIERDVEECFMPNDSNQIQYQSERQDETDNLLSNDSGNIEIKIERDVEGCFDTDNLMETKVENENCNDFESNVFYSMKSEKDNIHAASTDCHQIKLERDEGRDATFIDTSHTTTNTDGNQSTELYLNKQEKLKDCTVYIGQKTDERKEDVWENNETKTLTTVTPSDNQRIGFERMEKLNQRMRIDPGDNTETFSECHYVKIENVGFVDQNAKCGFDSDEAFNPNGQLNIHRDGKPYKCTVCDKTFTCASKLTRHMRHHTGESPFKCTVCGEVFTQKYHLITHMRHHTGETPFECSVCDKTFTQKVHLTTHLRFHRGEKPFDCVVCGKAFTQKSHLTTHLRLHMGEKPYYECVVCDKAFTRRSDLTKHMKIHSGQKPYKCTVCDKAFIQNCHLKIHMKVHTGEKPYYKCTACDKSFTRNSDLMVHIRHHTGEKPYKCTVCGKAFYQNFDLKIHMRIHTREKPHKCPVCFKTFIQKSHLTIHIRIHTGEKPHECLVCFKTFNQKSHLTKHSRHHSGKKNDKLSGCDKLFTQNQ